MQLTTHGAKHGSVGGLRLALSSAHEAGGASDLSGTEQAGSLQRTMSWNSKGCGVGDGLSFTVFQEYRAQVKFETVTIILLINKKCASEPLLLPLFWFYKEGGS